MNPDDWVDKCSYCEKPVIVSVFAIIFSKDGKRWTFDNCGCFLQHMIQEGYFVQDTGD